MPGAEVISQSTPSAPPVAGGRPVPSFLRSGTDDAAMWRDVYERDEYKARCEQLAGLSVLDVGAGVGSFAALVVDLGAHRVTSVEPNLGTCDVYCKVLRQELLERRAFLVNAAAWTCDGDAALNLFDDGRRSGDSLVFPTKGGSQTVLTVHFAHLVAQLRPDVLKVDCEGSEYRVFDDRGEFSVPSSVRLAWVEFHKCNEPKYNAHHQVLLHQFRAAGFSLECLKVAYDARMYKMKRGTQ